MAEEKRDVASETHFVTPGTSEAKSSEQCLYYHDLPPVFVRRAAKRHTVGHVKYGYDIFNLNWRIGITDRKYVVDRFNHLWEHLLKFQESGNEFDDNLGAIAWCVGFLMEVEEKAPHVFKQIFGHSRLFGEAAKRYRDDVIAQDKPKMYVPMQDGKAIKSLEKIMMAKYDKKKNRWTTRWATSKETKRLEKEVDKVLFPERNKKNANRKAVRKNRLSARRKQDSNVTRTARRNATATGRTVRKSKPSVRGSANSQQLRTSD